jgi:hypothetical protein
LIPKSTPPLPRPRAHVGLDGSLQTKTSHRFAHIVRRLERRCGGQSPLIVVSKVMLAAPTQIRDRFPLGHAGKGARQRFAYRCPSCKCAGRDGISIRRSRVDLRRFTDPLRGRSRAPATTRRTQPRCARTGSFMGAVPCTDAASRGAANGTGPAARDGALNRLDGIRALRSERCRRGGPRTRAIDRQRCRQYAAVRATIDYFRAGSCARRFVARSSNRSVLSDGCRRLEVPPATSAFRSSCCFGFLGASR